MSSPSFLSITDTQADSLGSPFPPSPYCPQSPQLSQIHLGSQGQKVDVDFLMREAFYGADTFSFKSDPGEIPPYLPCGEIVEYHPGYNSHVPSTDIYPSRYPSGSEFDDGSSTHSASPVMFAPIIWSTCICGCGGGPCIRQRPYRRPKGDPLEDDRLGELITFQVHGQCGMPLSAALRCVYNGLSGRDDPMFIGSRTSISIRLEWPGCSSWAQQMRTKDWRRKPSPITKAKLATEVAKKVDRFLKDMGRNIRGSQGDPTLPCHIDINRVALVALEHVSMASWQPHLRLI